MKTNRIKNIILDLDETLVSSIPTDEFPNKNIALLQKVMNGDCYILDGDYYVFERPNLQKFLTYIFKNFNVSVWSAGSKDYVAYIVENVIIGKNKNRHLKYVFWDKHCTDSKKIYKSLKDLNLLIKTYKLNYNKNNTILIDDLESNCKKQEKNCLQIKSFDITENMNDNELSKIMKSMKLYLKEVKTKSPK